MQWLKLIRSGSSAFALAIAASLAAGADARAQAVPTEREYNDTAAFADPIPARGSIQGTLTTGVDGRDVFDLTVPVEATLTAALTVSSGGTPALWLSDRRGRHIAVAQSTPRALRVALPVGHYFLTVAGGSASYTLATTLAPTTIPALVPSTPIVDAVGAPYDVRTFVLPVPYEAQVDVSVIAQSSLNVYLELGNADGGRIWYADDPASNGVGLSAPLPAGTWYVFIRDTGAGTGQFTITANLGATTIGLAPAPGAVTGNIASVGQRDLYRLILSDITRIDFSTAPGTAIRDTVLDLFDADLHVIATNDDSTGINLLSRVLAVLPAGIYYVGVRGYSTATGAYRLTGAVSTTPPSLTDLKAERLAVSQNADSVNGYRFRAGTDVPVQFSHSAGSARISVVDDMGRSRAYIMSTGALSLFGPGAANQVSVACGAAETLFVFAVDAGNQTLVGSLLTQGNLWFDPAGTTLQSLDKAGAVQHLFFGRGTTTNPIAPGAPVRGNLLLDPSRLILYLGSQTIASSGVATWPSSFQGFAVNLQALAVDPTGSPLTAWMTNVVR